MITPKFSLMRNLYNLLLEESIILDHVDLFDTLVIAVPYVPTIDEALKDLSKWHDCLMDEVPSYEMKSIFEESDENLIYKKLSLGIDTIVKRIPQDRYPDITARILEILTIKQSDENLKCNGLKYDKEKYKANLIDFTDYIAKINVNQKNNPNALMKILFAYIFFSFTMEIPTSQFAGKKKD